jgi:hypothetical protein
VTRVSPIVARGDIMVLTAEPLAPHTEPLSLDDLGVYHAIVRDIAL